MTMTGRKMPDERDDPLRVDWKVRLAPGSMADEDTHIYMQTPKPHSIMCKKLPELLDVVAVCHSTSWLYFFLCNFTKNGIKKA